MVLAKVDQSPISLLFGALPIGQFAVNKPNGAIPGEQYHGAHAGGHDFTIPYEDVVDIHAQAQSVSSRLYGRFPSNVGNRSTPEYLSETAILMDGWSDAPSGGA